MKLSIPCHVSRVKGCVDQVANFLGEWGVGERERRVVCMALVEAINNAVQNTPLSKVDRPLELVMECSTSRVKLLLYDFTPGFEWKPGAELPSVHEERGRGLYVIETLMDEVSYTRGTEGNCLRLGKVIPGEVHTS